MLRSNVGFVDAIMLCSKVVMFHGLLVGCYIASAPV